MPRRLQFTPDTQWRTRFETCVRKSSLDNSETQRALARRALLRKIFEDGVKRAEKTLDMAKNNKQEPEHPRREEVQQKMQQPPESTDEEWDELVELLKNFDFDDPGEEEFDGRAG